MGSRQRIIDVICKCLRFQMRRRRKRRTRKRRILIRMTLRRKSPMLPPARSSAAILKLGLCSGMVCVCLFQLYEAWWVKRVVLHGAGRSVSEKSLGRMQSMERSSITS